MLLTLPWQSLALLSCLLWELLGLFCHFALRSTSCPCASHHLPWKCLPSFSVPACLWGGFSLSQLSLSRDNLRFITFSQDGEWLLCPTASLRQQVAGSNLMGFISVERFLELKMGSRLQLHVVKYTEFHLPPVLSWPV